jgi:hypothetical protein
MRPAFLHREVFHAACHVHVLDQEVQRSGHGPDTTRGRARELSGYLHPPTAAAKQTSCTGEILRVMAFPRPDARGMEITASPASTDPIPGFPRKPLDNPPRPKPTYESDEECAELLIGVLRRVPDNLGRVSSSAFPLLTALQRVDAADGTDLARRLVCIAAISHRTADERATAEYLLRNRAAIQERSALSLLRAARCAAEMDIRRAHRRETPTSHDSLAMRPSIQPSNRTDDPSVSEMVVGKLRAATGQTLNPLVEERILDAVPIALELAERHSLNGGKAPSLLGMRCDARKQSRLVTQLRAAFRSDIEARNIARLLVGADGTPIENALLWWSARPHLAPSDVPSDVRARWTRYLAALERGTARDVSYEEHRSLVLA